MINRLLERMESVDPYYGTEEHQREFTRRYEARQAANPCPEDHEHTNACYRPKEKP